VAFVAVLGVCMLAAAGCANKDNGGGGGAQSANCTADQFGCLTVGSGEPIKIGTLLAISGDTRTLGLDSQRGVILAVDYLDGKLDGKPGQLMGHNVELVNTDETCSKEGGQAGATKLAADPKILSVIGTSCSSAALGVADTIFSKKGILLISPSNTGPALTADGQHQPFYLRTAHNDKIQGAVVADFATKKLGAKTAATINDGSPYADGLAAVFRQVFEKQGGKITNNEAIQPTDRDFKPVLNSIAQNKPDFLYYPDFSPACGLIAKQAQAIPALKDTALWARTAGPARLREGRGQGHLRAPGRRRRTSRPRPPRTPSTASSSCRPTRSSSASGRSRSSTPTPSTPSTSWPTPIKKTASRRGGTLTDPADQAQGRDPQDQQLQGAERDAQPAPRWRLRHGGVDRHLQGPGLADRGWHGEPQAGVHRDQDTPEASAS
jgi:ABC-type branched-subunit amino acid transport system substrate-binding protein